MSIYVKAHRRGKSVVKAYSREVKAGKALRKIDKQLRVKIPSLKKQERLLRSRMKLAQILAGI